MTENYVLKATQTGHVVSIQCSLVCFQALEGMLKKRSCAALKKLSLTKISFVPYIIILPFFSMTPSVKTLFVNLYTNLSWHRPVDIDESTFRRFVVCYLPLAARRFFTLRDLLAPIPFL